MVEVSLRKIEGISNSRLTADSLRDSLIWANSSFVMPVVWCFICRFLAARIFHGILDATWLSSGPSPSAHCAGSNVLAIRGSNSVLAAAAAPAAAASTCGLLGSDPKGSLRQLPPLPADDALVVVPAEEGLLGAGCCGFTMAVLSEAWRLVMSGTRRGSLALSTEHMSFERTDSTSEASSVEMPPDDDDDEGEDCCGSRALCIPDMKASAVLILDSSPHDSDPESPVTVAATQGTSRLLFFAPPWFQLFTDQLEGPKAK